MNTNSELVHRRARVIAVENIVLALLSKQPIEMYDKIREKAELISPREEVRHRPLTIEAVLHKYQSADRVARISAIGDK